MSTGQRMKARRKELGLSAEYVAKQLNLSPATIYRYENGGIDKVPGDILEPLARVLQTTPANLMGWESELLAELVKENESGRPAAVDEMRRRFGTEHSTLSAYVCEDKKKLSVLYYHALERGAALALKELIQDVEQLETKQVENIMHLVKAYLKAEQPIRDIVDTALRPYTEEEAALYEDQIG